jgi:entry exclusion lipoprotein TrbK
MKGKTVEHFKLWKWLILIAILGTACSQENPNTELQVNNETCKPENISGIKDKANQQQFASACARRGQFKASETKSW